jgi:hypothetical protein
MSGSGYNIKQYPHAITQRAGNQPAAGVTLPQSNGVNITIINPTTNVGGTAGTSGSSTTSGGATTTLVPNQPDSFTSSNANNGNNGIGSPPLLNTGGLANPAEALPNNAPVSMIPPGVNVSSSDGSFPPQTLSPTPNANTPATALNGSATGGGGVTGTAGTPTPSNPQEHLMQDYKNLDNQYQNLQKAEQDYADAQKRYQDLGTNVNTLAYQQNTGTPASGLPNATATNASTASSSAAGGNPFIFPIRQGNDGLMHVENPANSGFPPGYSPYATYNALTPLANSGGGNPAMPSGVFSNPADPPRTAQPSTMTFASTNPPLAASTPITTNAVGGTFAGTMPSSSSPPAGGIPPQAPPAMPAAQPPPQQVIITPTMTVPASSVNQPVPSPITGGGDNLAFQNPALAMPLDAPSSATQAQGFSQPPQPFTLPASQQPPLDFPMGNSASNTAEQQVLDAQLNSVLPNNEPAYLAPVVTNQAFSVPTTTQPTQGEKDTNPYSSSNTNFQNTSTNSPLGGFVPTIREENVPLPATAPAELPVGVLPENDGSFAPQDNVTNYANNNNSYYDGGSTNTMGLQMPQQAYNQYPPVQQQQQRPMSAPSAPQAPVGRPPQQQQQSFNATQVTPQDVAFFQEVLKMNPETAQVAGSLPAPQIAQLLAGDKELLGTVRQIEGMLPPGTPPSALAAMMPPPPQGGPAPNRPMMPPPQQPMPGMPQQQPQQRPMMPPPQQPNYGYAPQGR